MMAKETSRSIARLAARFLDGKLKVLSRKQQLSLAASALAQAEAEQESVKAWGLEDKITGGLDSEIHQTRETAAVCGGRFANPVRVKICRIPSKSVKIRRTTQKARKRK